MQIISLLAQQQYCHWHLTQYSTKHQWFSISSCAMNSTSKKALMHLLMLLVNFFHSLHVKRFSVWIVPIYCHDINVEFLDAPAPLSFRCQLDLTTTETLTLDSCRHCFAIWHEHLISTTNPTSLFRVTHQWWTLARGQMTSCNGKHWCLMMYCVRCQWQCYHWASKLIICMQIDPGQSNQMTTFSAHELAWKSWKTLRNYFLFNLI